jgi:hypothetical protein
MNGFKVYQELIRLNTMILDITEDIKRVQTGTAKGILDDKRSELMDTFNALKEKLQMVEI